MDVRQQGSDASRYATIRRAPRPADRFTIISNTAIRDRALKPADLGILVRLLSHQDGRGVSASTVAAENGIGRDAALGALSRLEVRGYLVRSQERRPDGTMGGGIYWVSDDPASLALLIDEQAEAQNEIIPDETPQNPSSQPKSVNPTPVEPTPGNQALRRTTTRRPSTAKRSILPVPISVAASNGNGNGESISGEDRARHASHPAARPASHLLSAGTRLLADVVAEQRVRLVGKPLREQGAVVDALLAADVDAALIRLSLSQPYTDSDSQPVRSIAAVVAHRLRELAPVIDAPGRLSEPHPQEPDDDRPWLLPPRSASEQPPPGQPPWCGNCDEKTRQIEVGDPGTWTIQARCPNCHPNANPSPDPLF